MNAVWKFAVVFGAAAVVASCAGPETRSGPGPGGIIDAGITESPEIARAGQTFDTTRYRLDAMSGDDVKSLYAECADSAQHGRLGSRGIAFCSVVYDVLLERHFGGDFDKLLAWSRQQADVGAGRS